MEETLGWKTNVTGCLFKSYNPQNQISFILNLYSCFAKSFKMMSFLRGKPEVTNARFNRKMICRSYRSAVMQCNGCCWFHSWLVWKRSILISISSHLACRPGLPETQQCLSRMKSWRPLPANDFVWLAGWRIFKCSWSSGLACGGHVSIWVGWKGQWLGEAHCSFLVPSYTVFEYSHRQWRNFSKIIKST